MIIFDSSGYKAFCGLKVYNHLGGGEKVLSKNLAQQATLTTLVDMTDKKVSLNNYAPNETFQPVER